jgi:hypothetical protein
MWKRAVVGVVALSAILALGAYTMLRPGSARPVHFYTVGQVAAGIAQHPQAWIGRTVVVRGIPVISEWATNSGMEASYCPSYSPCSKPVPPKTSVDLFLVDNMPRGVAASNQLLLTLQGERAGSPALLTVPPSLVVKVLPRPSQTLLVDMLAHVPLVSQFVAQPPTIKGGIAQTYRVRLLPRPVMSCTPACDDALLLSG